MDLAQLLPLQHIALAVPAADRAAAIHTLVGLLAADGVLADAEQFERDVLSREEQAPTDVGQGIALPHAKSAAVLRAGVAAVTLRTPLPTAAGEPLRLLFLIAAPADAPTEHLRIMAALADRLRRPELCARLLAAANPAEFASALLEDPAQAAQQEEGAAPDPADPGADPPHYRVLAVTACPTGIAHTFLAKEALLEKAGEMGISLKVEANGAAGVEDPLTDAEIDTAECIIVAADRTVPIDRFAGKPLLRVPVGEAVRHPEQLLHRALSATAPDFVPPVPNPFSKGMSMGERLSTLGHHLYTHLMSGITRMLPFITGGGLLIAFSYLLQTAGQHPWIPQGDLPVVLYNLGQSCFAVMYVVLAGFIASSLGDALAFVPGAMGGYLAWSGMTTAASDTWVSSGFWGALVAGFSAGLLMRGMARLCKRLPKTLDQVKVTLLYPVISLFFITVLMVYFINPPLGQFNDWTYRLLTNLHGGSRLVLCAILGALMAVDYGGPVNKAAYVFGTVALVNEQYDIMAAVMVGGMTPPIGIAIACLLFPEAFTRFGKRAAPSNFLLGASFVTEGALPYVLRDPLHVIPACLLGSMLAGALSQGFGCGIPAPHGGLFLLPVMTNPWGFLMALAAGSSLTAALLGLFKPHLSEKAAAMPTTVIVHRDV